MTPFSAIFRLSVLTLGLLAVASVARTAHAQSTDEFTGCVQQTFERLARQDRLFRTVVLGRGPAASAPVGTVWYDDATGDAWQKDDDSTWRTLPGDTVRSDSEMEDAAERDPSWTSPLRRGILSTRTTLTSSLIPALTQSYRALQCRLETVCRLTTGRVAGAVGDTDLDVDGCLPPADLHLDDITACQFTKESAARDSIDAAASCQQAMNSILQHEAEGLRLLTAYDAATRTALQFTGVFDRFVDELRIPLLWPLIELGNLLSDLTGIPCFLGLCAP